MTQTALAPTPVKSGSYTIDASHSRIGFAVRHAMISKVRGHFGDVAGTVRIGDDLTESSVDVSVQLAGIDTGNDQRDDHLRSPDFLDVDQYPTMTFTATSVTPTDDASATLVGELTVHGVTKPITLDVAFEGAARDPFGSERLGFSASGEIQREAFGLTWNQALETGGVLVGKTVKIEIEAELVASD